MPSEDAAPVAPAGGVITFGETMGLLTALDIGALERAHSFRYGIGGAESNVAIGVARLGRHAAWFGRIGADATGDMIADRLRAEGVTAFTIRDDRRPTGLMVRHRRFAHVHNIDYHRAHSAGSALAPHDIPQAAVRGAQILHVTGITPALSATAAETVFAAIDIARAARVLVSVDVNYRSKLWAPEAAAPVLRALAERADILFAGPEEAQLVLGDTSCANDADLARALAKFGASDTIIKAGARGCAAIIDDQDLRRAALNVDAIDTVGAGDAFVAGYLSERMTGSDVDTRLNTAIHVGALAVTVPGDCEGLPHLSDLRHPLSAEDVLR
jgi:2-dehydro-3-deoxygluconokinase